MKKIIVLMILLAIIPLVSADITMDDPHLIAWYDFQGSSSNLVDLDGGDNNGTDISVGGFTMTKSQPGILGNAWKFNMNGSANAGSYVNVSNYWGASDDTNFSWQAWVNVTAGLQSGTGGITLGAGNGSDTNVYDSFFVNTNGNTQTGGFSSNINNGTDVDNGNWNHLVLTGDGTHLRIYVNGTEVSKLAATADAFTELSSIGAVLRNNVADSFFNGTMDEVAVWNRTLTPTEISDLWNNGAAFSPFTSGVSVLQTLPEDGTASINQSYEFTSNVTAVNTTLVNATYFIWDSGGTIFNQTTVSVTGTGINQTSLNVSGFSVQNHTWNVLGCANLDNGTATCSFAPTNFSLQVQSHTVDSEEYDLKVLDTDNSTFVINITLLSGSTLQSGKLVYNGTEYSVPSSGMTNISSTQFSLMRTIDIPEAFVAGNKTWYWKFTINPGGTGFQFENSPTQSHFVNQTNFTTSGSAIAINFTIVDEETLTPVAGTLDGTFTWYLGDGVETKNNSFDLDFSPEHLFYVSPENETFYTSSTLFVVNDSVNSTWTGRVFDFNKQLYSNDTKVQLLPIPNSSITRDFIVDINEGGTTPLSGAFVTIERFYPGRGEWIIVENRETDSRGQFVARLIERINLYRITIRDSNNIVLGEADPFQSSPACIGLVCRITINIDNQPDLLERYSNIEGYQYNPIEFNNVTNNFTFIWSDTNVSGLSITHSLIVQRKAFNGTTNVCDYVNSSAAEGQLTCNVGSAKASYTATVYRYQGDKKFLIDTKEVKVGSLAGVFGTEGLFWAFILLFTLVLVGSTINPIAGVILYLAGFLALGVFDVILINPIIMIANLVIGVLFIWAFKG